MIEKKSVTCLSMLAVTFSTVNRLQVDLQVLHSPQIDANKKRLHNSQKIKRAQTLNFSLLFFSDSWNKNHVKKASK